MTQAASLARRMSCYRRMIDKLLDHGQFADLVLRGGTLVNVLTRELYQADVAVAGEYILLVGDCGELVGPKTQLIDVAGKFIAPGFIDSHMHFESAMLTLSEFSRFSIASGTTTLFADPHEIGNVSGISGIGAMLEEAATLPNRVLFTVPCLTPDIPGFETAGSEITSRNLDALIKHPLVQGLGEMQGFSSVRPVYSRSPAIVDDLLSSVFQAHERHKTVEGNAPSLFGAELAAHILACGGRTSCHETTSKDECVEKLRADVTVFMREGSTQKNMAECIRAVTEEGMDSRNLVLVSDDMLSEDLVNFGHMNELIRRTIAQGIDPVEAIQMATINAARHFGRNDIGCLAPGKAADIVIIRDLRTIDVEMVIMGGRLVAQNRQLLIDIPRYTYPDAVKSTVKRQAVKPDELKVAAGGNRADVQGLVIVPDQNITHAFSAALTVENGWVTPDIAQDVLPIVVVERHGRSGDIGKSFVKGLGLREGAIALSVGHDTHNIVACGANYVDLSIAINRVIAMQGGLALVKDHKVVGDMRLPIAGLMTDECSAEEVSARLTLLDDKARESLGCHLHAPFMHLSFLTLVTSPSRKITDKGLVDTENLRLIDTIMQ
ncbi:adenine deaminase [Brenneria sp. 4F2]|nr:adenine deaminase [Brenneria bubanii]